MKAYLVLTLYSTSCSGFVPSRTSSSLTPFKPWHIISYISTESDISLSDSPQMNYSEEDKVKVRMLLLERTLSEMRERNLVILNEKSNLESQLQQAHQREVELKTQISDLAKEMHFLANELLEQSKEFSVQENILRSTLDEGQRNLTRSHQQLKKYMVESETMLKEKSDLLVKAKLKISELQRQIDILSSRVKIMETVLSQSKVESNLAKGEIKRLEEEVIALKAEKSKLIEVVEQLNLEKAAAKNSSDVLVPVKEKLKDQLGSDSESSLTQFYDGLTEVLELKRSVLTELTELKQFIADAKLEYRSLVTATTAVNNAKKRAYQSIPSSEMSTPFKAFRQKSAAILHDISKYTHGERNRKPDSDRNFGKHSSTEHEDPFEKFLRIISVDGAI